MATKQQPKTEIEKELADAAGLLDAKGNLKLNAKEDRQDWLKRLATSIQEIESDEWDALSEEAQEWCNGAIDAIEKNADIDEPEDEDGGAASDDAEDGDEQGEDDTEAEEDDAGEDDEDADEDGEGDDQGEDDTEEDEPAPKKGGKAKPEPKKAAKGKADTKAPAKKGGKKDDAAEEDEPAPKKGAAKGKSDAKSDAKKTPAKGKKDEDDDADDKPAKKPRAPAKPAGAQAAVKRAIIDNPSATIDDLLASVKKAGYEPTRLAVSTIRSGMMQTLRLMKEMGKLKGVTLPN